MIKYFSQMLRKAEEPKMPEAPETQGFEEENNISDLEGLDEAPSEETSEPVENEDTAKDTVKFNIWAERTSKQAGYTVEVVPSSSNRALKINIDDSTDIVTQKDAIKLAVLLDDNNMGWQLMDDPIVKSGGAWTIKMSKAEV
jgi:tetraacyldisaccharide-1-P 4'-kinase